MDANAPEVNYSARSYPIPLPDERQGLQRHLKSDKAFVSAEEKSQPEMPRQYGTAPTYSRSKWPLLVAGIVALAIGLGAGIGIGYAVGHKSAGNAVTVTTSGTSTAVAAVSSACSAATAATSTPTLDSHVPIYGYTSIPYTNCSGVSSTYTSHVDNSTFTKMCDYVFDGGSGSTIEIGNARKAYSFETCMDMCMLWNNGTQPGSNSDTCVALTYTSDYEGARQVYGGNCFLKTGQGNAVPGGDFGSALTPNVFAWASAYVPTRD